jgi:hypothetical protein
MTHETGEILLCEAHRNATAEHFIGEERQSIGETIFADTPLERLGGELFRFSVREHGRCIGRVYVDTDDGTVATGWVFQKRVKYQDDDETYLHETWITVERVVAPARPTVVEAVAL